MLYYFANILCSKIQPLCYSFLLTICTYYAAEMCYYALKFGKYADSEKKFCRLTARATLSTQVQTCTAAFSRDCRLLVGSLSVQEISLASSSVPKVVVRPLVLLHPRSLCPPSSPWVRSACTGDATPQWNNGLLCQHYAWCFERSILCLILCRHKILTPTLM